MRAPHQLPDFPWDSLAPFHETARAHPGGVVDLSVGTPVDEVPQVAQDALRSASNWPGYPTTVGTTQLREAAADWLGRCCQAEVSPSALFPTIGSKELVAWLPSMLGLGATDAVVYPPVAYPTYAVGAQLARAQGIPADPHLPDAQAALADQPVALVWLNSPANPTGRVLSVEQLQAVVAWARQRGIVVASDECYFELAWSQQHPPTSILHPQVCGGSHEGLLAVHSLSKRSNLAGYRAGIIAGDPVVVGELLEINKHAGMMVPGPVQQAMAAAFADDSHVQAQRERYRARREVLHRALLEAGFQIEYSHAGLYLWATRGEDCWQTVAWLADRGIVVAPGSFYGPESTRHVRVALTATDERIAAAAQRLGE